MVAQAPLRTTPCCAICARAVRDSVHWFVSLRFSLIWFPFCHVCIDLAHLAYDVLSCYGLYRRMLAIVLSS